MEHLFARLVGQDLSRAEWKPEYGPSKRKRETQVSGRTHFFSLTPRIDLSTLLLTARVQLSHRGAKKAVPVGLALVYARGIKWAPGCPFSMACQEPE